MAEEAAHPRAGWIKAVKSGREALSIDVPGPGGEIIGFLEPVTAAHIADPELPARMTRWRNAAQRFFLTRFPGSPERTRAWLESSVLSEPGRMLFLVRSPKKLVGQCGFIGLNRESAELDNLIRGEMGGHPRLMYYAEAALLSWIFESLDLSTISAGVLSENPMAGDLHASLGFRVCEVLPLSRSEEDGACRLTPGRAGEPSADGLYYNVMMLTRERFTALLEEIWPNGRKFSG